MKNRIILLGLTSILAACSAPDKKAELENLRKQEAEIKSKIATLEGELKDSTQQEKGPALIVAVRTLKAAPFKSYIDVVGHVDADENISLSSELPGTVTRIHVKVGDEVSKGQVLAETDARTIEQSIADLQSNLDLSTQLFNKQKALWDQKIGTEVQFLQAKTQKESLERKMSSLQEQLRMSKVISPINGTVDAVDVKLGQSIAPGVPAIRVINFSNLKVKADVAESYAAKVKKGAEIIVRFPDIKDSLVTKVNFVARAINAMTRTFSVEVLLDNKNYHPNMVTKLSINDYISSKPVLSVPVRTIQKDETNQNFVYIAENGKAVKKIVAVGKEYNGLAEILSGLNEGDQLIELGYDSVNNGDPVSINK